MRMCQLTGKHVGTGNNVSHSKRRTPRKFRPNLLVTRINGQRLKVAASTLRTLKKWAKVPAEKVAA